jgi:SAM-dependent methyltransferase
MPLPVAQALDVGCGAGLSTKALQPMARECLGIDPSPVMIQCASALVPGATFKLGAAEKLPVPSRSMDLISAAGSLNYADLSLFFPEVARVLVPKGVLLVYDFSQGRSFRDSPILDRWFSKFLSRYPMPVGSGRPLSPEILASLDSELRMDGQEDFEIGLVMAPGSYVDYVMTETNIAHAIGNRMPVEQIRDWCTETLATVFEGKPREVLFRGYLACMINQAG